jgi:hypothetical protein
LAGFFFVLRGVETIAEIYRALFATGKRAQLEKPASSATLENILLLACREACQPYHVWLEKNTHETLDFLNNLIE